MFGMALKFFQLGLEPINVLRNSDVSNRQASDSNSQPQSTKKASKSSEDIKSSKPSSVEFQKFDPLGQKQNGPEEKLKTSRINSVNISEEDLEELKQSQKKILEDLKISISKTLSSPQSPLKSEENNQVISETNSKIIYEKVDGLVLSKIEELSEEYLEYSMQKDSLIKQNSVLNSKSQDMSNSNRAVSCELIKSIVKSVLLDGNDLEEGKLSNSIKKDGEQNFQTHQSSQRSLESNETVTEFIKDLFASLGLVNEQQLQSSSLKELTLSAKKHFNELKGNDYVQKLHQMLQSVQNIDHQASKLKLSKSLKVSYLYNPNSQTENLKTIKKATEEKQNNSRKEILIKKEEDKKVKLVAPETFSELQARRNTIESQISEAIQFLTKTRRARKFAFHSTEIIQVYLNFSMDFKFMSYKQVESKFFTHSNFKKVIRWLCSCTKGEFGEMEEKEEDKMTMLSLPWNLVNVSKGIKTRNFIKYEEQLANDEKMGDGEGLHEDRCLSLLFKNRTYDFEFESSKVRDEYFKAIKILIKSSFDL